MQELKDKIQDFIHGDKASFTFVTTRLSVFLLFFINLYLPFFFEPTIVTGQISLVGHPGGSFFAVILFLSILGYFYFYIIGNQKFVKIILWVQAIFATIIYLYGFLGFKVAFPDTATAGFGKHLGFILLFLIWFLFFSEKLILSLIKKYILKETVVEEVLEEKEN